MRGSRLADSHRAWVCLAPGRRQEGRPSESSWSRSGWFMRCLLGLSFALLLCGLVGASAAPPSTFGKPSGALAQAPQPTPAPGTPAPPGAPPVATINQPITVQAGTGVLLRLPQPAATVMSAEPDIARVQPASPTSLFLMGVAPGRTTVIATTDAGLAIVQYDVTVAPGAGGAVPARPHCPRATVTSATASARNSGNIARTVAGRLGACAFRPAGNDVILTGTVPNAVAAQQSEAIARGYVGEKAGVIDNLKVLGAIQVNVRVRIAEINRSVTRQLGFNWQALGSSNGWRFGLRTGAAVTSPHLAAAAVGTATARQRNGAAQPAWRRIHLRQRPLGRQWLSSTH